MIFLLGAFSAGLVALMLLPAFWRRALRLSRRRLDMLMPLSMDEVVAERDLLRAEFATERRKIEQKMEAQGARHAEDMIELGRRTLQIVTLEHDLADLRKKHDGLTADHAVATRDLAEAMGERGALITEIHDATGLHDRMRGRLEALSTEHAALGAVAEQRGATIAALEAAVESLTTQAERLTRGVEDHARAAHNADERAAGLGEERDMLLKELRAAQQMIATVQGQLDAERARADQMRSERDGVRRDLDSALIGQRESQKAAALAEAARETAETNIAEASRRLARHAEETRSSESATADRMQALRAEIATLQGALTAAREARGAKDDHAAAGPEAAQLRAAIADIGAKVARMAREE